MLISQQLACIFNDVPRSQIWQHPPKTAVGRVNMLSPANSVTIEATKRQWVARSVTIKQARHLHNMYYCCDCQSAGTAFTAPSRHKCL